jgi:hypothetical protein
MCYFLVSLTRFKMSDTDPDKTVRFRNTYYYATCCVHGLSWSLRWWYNFTELPCLIANVHVVQDDVQEHAARLVHLQHAELAADARGYTGPQETEVERFKVTNSFV